MWLQIGNLRYPGSHINPLFQGYNQPASAKTKTRSASGQVCTFNEIITQRLSGLYPHHPAEPTAAMFWAALEYKSAHELCSHRETGKWPAEGHVGPTVQTCLEFLASISELVWTQISSWLCLRLKLSFNIREWKEPGRSDQTVSEPRRTKENSLKLEQCCFALSV